MSTPLPKWFERTGPFSAVVDLTGFGYAKVEIRDPSGGQFAELVDMHKRHGGSSVRGMAATMSVYIKAVLPGGTNPMPAPGAQEKDWQQWVSETPSMVIRRIIDAGDLLGPGDSEGN